MNGVEVGGHSQRVLFGNPLDIALQFFFVVRKDLNFNVVDRVISVSFYRYKFDNRAVLEHNWLLRSEAEEFIDVLC